MPYERTAEAANHGECTGMSIIGAWLLFFALFCAQLCELLALRLFFFVQPLFVSSIREVNRAWTPIRAI